MKNYILLVLLLASLTGCKKEAKYAANAEEATLLEATVADLPGDKAVTGADYTDDTTTISEKVIKNADLRFQTDDVTATATRIQQAVRKHGALVQNDSEGKSGDALTRTMTIRIPGKKFEGFITAVSKGVSYFDRKDISSSDVTDQYIDLEARVKAKKVLEARYLDLISKAKKVSEILEIEKELSTIREEIEAKEGQLRYLNNRVDLSTVTIEFYKETAAAPDATVSYGSKMANALKSGFNALSSFFIALLYIWPFILIFVIVLFIFRKRFKKRKEEDYDVPN